MLKEEIQHEPKHFNPITKEFIDKPEILTSKGVEEFKNYHTNHFQ